MGEGMTQPADNVNQKMQMLDEAFKHAGIKKTHQRIEIFREVIETDEHPDAETIYMRVRERIPTISLDTVYRTLEMLVELGLITTLKAPHERMRFDANMHIHHHFVCVQCGLIRDFYSPAFDALHIPDSVNVFGVVKQTHVEVRGLCWRCAEKHQD